jgi:hypothetical protein
LGDVRCNQEYKKKREALIPSLRLENVLETDNTVDRACMNLLNLNMD